MSDKTKIEWASLGLPRGATWNPIRARNVKTGATGHFCEKVSPACDHCYAERFNLRGVGTGVAYKPGHRQKGGVEIYLDEKALLDPLRWKAPRGIFVCSMTDLFADFVTDDMRDRIFAVMALAPQHRFAVLTKRAARMRKYLNDGRWSDRILIEMCRQMDVGHLAQETCERYRSYRENDKGGPLRNVWLGCTVEDQKRADERIPELLATPAALRWISVEPMLGAIDPTRLSAAAKYYPGHHLEKYGQAAFCGWQLDALRGAVGWIGNGCSAELKDEETPRLDWVVCGGESGSGARPMHPDWARGLRDQCAAAGVPFFFKQWGEWKPISEMQDGEADALYRSKVQARDGESQSALDDIYGNYCTVKTDAIGYGGARGHDAFFVIETPQGQKGGMQMFRLGKARAGRLLDGVEHNAFPVAE